MENKLKATIMPVMQVLLGVVVLALFLYAVVYFDLREQVTALFKWLDELGLWGPVIFMLIYTLVVMLVLPGFVFTLGAGFLFGILPGFAYVVIATMTGATAAFFLGEYFLGERTAKYLRRKGRLRFLADHFIGKGWRIILLTRLTPLFPFKLSNYIMGLARFNFKDFFIGTFFGIMPMSFANAYIGAMAADLATLRAENIQQSPLRWTIYGAGLLVLVGLITYLAVYSWRVLNSYREHGEGEKNSLSE
ncbi:MAG: TVP38/TMEM64 family protein [Lentisphaeria bacterium]